ncbi:MAG: hypothetical protein ACOX8S_09835 [Christensenellales bacterium]|jgi:hypothetical protein
MNFFILPLNIFYEVSHDKKENKKRMVAVALLILERIAVIALLILAYMIIYHIGKRYFKGIYVYSWTLQEIIFFFALVSVAFAVFKKYIPAAASVTGYMLGILLGEVIGTPLYSAQMEMMQNANNWTPPQHYGWLICIITFFAVPIIVMIIQRICANKKTGSPG